MKKAKIGFIGQGWVGRNYADDFEKRGYSVVRYALEAQYAKNKDDVASCDIVFIAVPTPTTVDGFSDKIVRGSIALVGKGKIAVIKSTVIIGTTCSIQDEYPDRLVLASPEFLSESTAVHDAAYPDRNIVGIPLDNLEYRSAANKVLAVLPSSPYQLVCSSDEAEFIKYAHNVNGYIQVVLSNILYDVSAALDIDWSKIRDAFNADPYMSHRYLNPLDKNGRGAGGHCFIKDFEAFSKLAKSKRSDAKTLKVLEAIKEKNIELLRSSGKDIDLLEGVYGPTKKPAVIRKTQKIKKIENRN